MTKQILVLFFLIVFLTTAQAKIPTIAHPFVFPQSWSSSKPSEAQYSGYFHTYQLQFVTFNPFVAGVAPNLPLFMTEIGDDQDKVTALVIRDPITGKYLPYMAQSYQLSDSGKVITFTLRQGMRFSDGTLITAHDFVATATIEKNPTIAAVMQNSPFFKDIKFSAPNEYTLVMKFPFPNVQALNIASLLIPWPAHVFMPVYNKQGAKGIRNLWTLHTPLNKILSAGPFVPAKIIEGQRVIFKRNPYFAAWNVNSQGQQLPYLSGIQVNSLTSNALPIYLDGKLDTLHPKITPLNLGQIREISEAIKAHQLNATLLPNVGPSNNFSFLVFNWNLASNPFLQGLFRNKSFRHAMSELVNRQQMIAFISGGLGYKLYGQVPLTEQNWINPNMLTFGYNPEKAIKTLATLGFTRKNKRGILINNKGQPLKFNLLVPVSTKYERMADLFAQSAREIGVSVHVLPLTFAMVAGHVAQMGKDRNFQAVILGSNLFNPDWPFESQLVMCGGGHHIYNFLPNNKCLDPTEAKIQQIYFQGLKTFNKANRIKLAYQLQALSGELQPSIYLYAESVSFTWNNRLGGFFPKKQINAVNGAYMLPLVYVRK